MKGNVKKLLKHPQQIDTENSSTIEGRFREILKRLLQHPLKVTLKSPVIVEIVKFILIIFNQRAIKDSQKFPLLLKEY